METDTNIIPPERLQAVSTIMAGLLASGHYTSAGNSAGSPTIKSWDAGKDYKEEGLYRRFQRHVIGDAFSLLNELDVVLMLEAKERAKASKTEKPINGPTD